MFKGGDVKNWTPLSDTEYTEREANRELKQLKYFGQRTHQFRKKCVYNGPIQVLSVRNNYK